jgi:hypothetical protein
LLIRGGWDSAKHGGNLGSSNTLWAATPLREDRGTTLRQPEVPEVYDEPEEQYNIRIRRSLKKRLKRLVIEEEKPMGVILEKMLELYLQHRAQRAERADQ